MSQILFLTNMEQTAAYLQDALKLAQQTQEAVTGQVLYVPSDTEWTKEIEKQLQQAEVVIFPWMGTGLFQLCQLIIYTANTQRCRKIADEAGRTAAFGLYALARINYPIRINIGQITGTDIWIAFITHRHALTARIRNGMKILTA